MRRHSRSSVDSVRALGRRAEPCNKVALSHTVSQRRFKSLSRSRLQGNHRAGALGFLGHWRTGR